MATKIDPGEYINPKKTLRRREAEAEGDSVKRAVKSAGGEMAPKKGDIRFEKGWTKEELAEQDRKLREMLRKRQPLKP